MHADVSGVHVGPVGVCGVFEVVVQEVGLVVVLTFDPELNGEESIEVAVGIDVTSAAAAVVVDTGVAVMLVVVTPSAAIAMVVEAAECSFFLLLHNFALCSHAVFHTGVGGW